MSIDESRKHEALKQMTEALAQLNITVSAAESYGAATGMLAMNQQAHVSGWLALLKQQSGDADAASPGQASSDQNEVLQAQFEQVKQDLHAEGFDFSLHVIDHAGGVIEQFEAMKLFCQGFLMGAAEHGLKDIHALPEDTQSIIKDFAEIGSASDVDVNADEESEAALVELIEYLRISVQLFSTEIHYQAQAGDKFVAPLEQGSSSIH